MPLFVPINPAEFVRGGAKQIPRVGEAGGLALPAAPTLAYSAGNSGTLSLSTSSVQNLTEDSVVFSQQFSWTPSVAGNYTFFVYTPPSGWVIKAITTGFFPNSNLMGISGTARGGGIDVTVANAAATGNIIYTLVEIQKT